MHSKSCIILQLLLLFPLSVSPFDLVDLHAVIQHVIDQHSLVLTEASSLSQLLENNAEIHNQISTTLNTALYNTAETSSSLKYTYSPPPLPLSPLIKPEFSDLVDYAKAVSSIFEDVEEVVAGDAIQVKDVLEDAILPSNNVDLSAIVIGEISAGIIGGMSSQAAALVLNDKKRDSFVYEEISTGAYFGVRSIVRVASSLVGIPRPIANFIAGISASLFSESAKVEGRRRDQKFMKSLENMSMRPFDLSDRPGDLIVDRRFFLREDIRRKGVIRDINFARRDNVLCYWETDDEEVWMKASDIWVLDDNEGENFQVNNDPLNKFVPIKSAFPRNAKSTTSFASLITLPEVMMDVSKWVAYDLLLPDSAKKPVVNLFEISKSGALAGILGNFVFEVLKKNNVNGTMIGRFGKAGVEGAALFAAYEEAIAYINSQQEIRQVLGNRLPFIPYDED